MDKFILITGASSGIGAATAVKLSESSNLILCGRNLSKLEETANKCCSGRQIDYWECDLEKVSDINDSLKKLLSLKNVVVDGLVHCAGLDYLMAAKSFELVQMQKMLDVNLLSAMEIIKVLLKKVNESALKRIVFVSALYSIKAVKGNSFYAATKGALDSYMRSLALELAPRVRVNSVLPGGVRTPMSEYIFENEETKDIFEKQYPLGFGKVEDVAEMIDFLMSEKAKWITGQQISVDGGASI